MLEITKYPKVGFFALFLRLVSQKMVIWHQEFAKSVLMLQLHPLLRFKSSSTWHSCRDGKFMCMLKNTSIVNAKLVKNSNNSVTSLKMGLSHDISHSNLVDLEFSTTLRDIEIHPFL